ncbi:hypothetical protein [Modestobacter versicolor]|uniref:hypothetical protein n=1 Tax=Modestobacter versicolor TaxID=429133 RepID=UPI0034DDFE30
MAHEWTAELPLTAPREAASTRLRLVAAAVAAVIAVLQVPAAAFSYDAASYWGGATALVRGGDVFGDGFLALRGVLTSVVYVPAALVTRIGGDDLAGPAVLLENALLIGVLGAFLLPALLGAWRTVTPPVVWACALGAAVLLRGLAPFPLMDLWAAGLVLATVVLLGLRRWWALALAGLAGGAALNVRPATLVAVAAVGVVVLVARRWAGGWFVLGAAVALLPQFVLNRARGATWVPWPELTSQLTGVQASYASFVVRYDTVVAGDAVSPQLFFCSPSMAAALDGDPPSSTGQLAVAYLQHLPQAVVLSVQKIGSAVHWPLSMPYYQSLPVVNGLFAVLVTAVSVLGAVALLHRLVQDRRPSSTVVAGLVAWAASVLTLVTSATETRFAVVLVLFGIAGVAGLATTRWQLPRRGRGLGWLVGALALVALVYLGGSTGLAHPVVGDVTAETCAAA